MDEQNRMLTLSADQGSGRRGSSFGAPSSPRRPGERPLSSASKSTLSSVIYQSEQRIWEQMQPECPSQWPAAGSQGGDGKSRRIPSLGEEGVVHFSVPARVSALDSGAGDIGEGGMFTVELWQVLNRARRVRAFLCI